MIEPFACATNVVRDLRPKDPVFCLRPKVLSETARRLAALFPGPMLYAVKCNDNLAILRALYDGGIRHFDTASPAEIRSVATNFPDATCHYMHPVKSTEAITEAFHQYGVRSFAFDHKDELAKILAIVGDTPVNLMLRIAVERKQAIMDLSGKFGASADKAVSLLRAARGPNRRLGITFHVGSQCISPAAYARAIQLADRIVKQSGVQVDLLDVGGGFPAQYSGTEPEFGVFAQAIVEAVAQTETLRDTELSCEPGRALVADGMSVLVRVELRRSNALYLNDGTYGSLSELKYLGPCFPMRVIRPEGDMGDAPLSRFRLFGPTCDSVDSMPGPFWLPAGIRSGDYIEIAQMGAYSTALRTRFNGFDKAHVVAVADEGPRNRIVAEPQRVVAVA